MGVPIRRAGEGDRETVNRLLDEGFFRDPVSNWIFPEEEYRRRTHKVLMGAFLDTALAEGHVDMTDDGSAAALWLSMPAEPHSGSAQDASSDGHDSSDAARLREAIDPSNERIEQIARLTGEAHPTHRAHEYLMLIAVSPALHGKGLGTALLSAALDRCDRESRAAYLEASSPRSRALYERLGFTFMGRTVDLPGGPPMFPMWRDPQSA